MASCARLVLPCCSCWRTNRHPMSRVCCAPGCVNRNGSGPVKPLLAAAVAAPATIEPCARGAVTFVAAVAGRPCALLIALLPARLLPGAASAGLETFSMRGACCCAQGAAGVGSPLAAPLVLLPVLLLAPAAPPGATLPALTPAAAAGLEPCGCADGVARGGAPAVVLAGATDFTATVPVADCRASVPESTGRCTMLVSVARGVAWLAGFMRGWFSGEVTAYGACMLLPSAHLPQVALLPRKGLSGSGAATVPAADKRAPPAPVGGASG